MSTEITTAQIETLRTEAGEVGDDRMVATCDRALDGDEKARAACARVIRDAAAQADER